MFFDSVPPLQKLVVGLTAIVVLFILWGLVRIFNNPNNPLEWWHLISMHSADGHYYPDWNQIGKGLGVVLCVWLPAVYVYSPHMDSGGLALIMGVALGYLGGVSAYAATLRSKQGAIETTTVTESAQAKITTATKVETPPVKP